MDRYIFALLPNPTDTKEVLQPTCVALRRKGDALDLAKPFLPLAFRFEQAGSGWRSIPAPAP